jgi:hypothetical protein
MRSVAQIEARHTAEAEQLLRDLAGTVARTGALLHRTISTCLVLSPEHAHLLAGQGWDKPAVRRFVFEEARLTRDELDRVGKTAVSRTTSWRLPADHPEAVPDDRIDPATGSFQVLTSPDAVQIVVAGASNSGVSAVVDTFGPRGDPGAACSGRAQPHEELDHRRGWPGRVHDVDLAGGSLPAQVPDGDLLVPGQHARGDE